MGCFFVICVGLGIALIIIMNVNLIVGGICIIAFSFVAFYASAKNKKDLFNIEATKTYKIKEIIDIYNIAKEEVGRRGRFRMLVSIEGYIQAATNSAGLVYVRVGTGNTQIRAQNKQFIVADDTGQIIINTEKLGLFHDTNFAYMQENPIIPNARITGIIEGPVYVVGEASDVSNELMIRSPRNKEKSFVVALKSKEKHFQHTKIHPVIYTVLGIIILLTGLTLIINGIIQKM